MRRYLREAFIRKKTEIYWSFTNKGVTPTNLFPFLLLKIEYTQRAFTAKINSLKHLDYLDRLKSLKLYSTVRHIEIYRLLYIRKILIGSVPNCGLIWAWDPIHGVKFQTPKVNKYFTASRETCFQYTATRLYNILPREMRDDLVSPMDT